MVLSYRIFLERFQKLRESIKILIRKRSLRILMFLRITKTMSLSELLLFIFQKRKWPWISWKKFLRKFIGKKLLTKEKRSQLLSSVFVINLKREKDNKFLRRSRLYRLKKMRLLMRKKFPKRKRLKSRNMRIVRLRLRSLLMKLCRITRQNRLKRF